MANVTSTPPASGPSKPAGVSGGKRPSKARRAVGKAAGVISQVAPVAGAVGGPWGKGLAMLAGAASSVIEQKMAARAASDAPPPAAESAVAGGTEAKLAALMGPGGHSAAGAGGASGAVSVGTKIIGGVVVAPEPYDSEMGPRLAIAARVFGAANALELAVSRLIDLPAGQLLTFCMNRGFR